MKGVKGFIIAAAAVYLAAAAQAGAASRFGIYGTHLHAPLLILGFLSLYLDRKGGAILGFATGFIEGSMAGANLWQYVLTRVLVGATIAWIAEGGIERNLYTTVLFSMACVVAAEVTFMFFAPPPQVFGFLGDTIRTAVYNGVLAMLLYALFNRFLSPRR